MSGRYTAVEPEQLELHSDHDELDLDLDLELELGPGGGGGGGGTEDDGDGVVGIGMGPLADSRPVKINGINVASGAAGGSGSHSSGSSGSASSGGLATRARNRLLHSLMSRAEWLSTVNSRMKNTATCQSAQRLHCRHVVRFAGLRRCSHMCSHSLPLCWLTCRHRDLRRHDAAQRFRHVLGTLWTVSDVTSRAPECCTRDNVSHAVVGWSLGLKVLCCCFVFSCGCF
jgi:hypothetical protein